MSPVPRLIRWIVLLAALFLGAMTALRLAAFFAFRPGATPLSGVGDAFLLGLRFDGRVVAAIVFPLLLLGPIRWLDPFRSVGARRIWFVVLTAVSAALVVFYVSDFLHFRYLNQRLNASVLGFAADARISAGMAWQSYPLVRIALGSIAGIALMGWTIVAAHRRASSALESPRSLRRFAWFFGVGLVCTVAIYGRVGQYPLRWSDAFSLRYDFSANLALNPLQSFMSSLDFRKSNFDLAKVRTHYPQMAAYLGVDSPDTQTLSFRRVGIPSSGGRPSPNVVMVICESFSAYKSSMWGNSLDTTPFFKEMCAQGLFFDNCYTPHFGTARGVWATITGIPDVEPVETASRNPAIVDQHTIVNDFAGYEKYYFLGGSSSWANIRGLLSANIKGLKLFEEGSFRAPRVDVWGVSDKNLFLEANDILKNERKPFFAIIQTAGNHRPYTIPKEDLGEFSNVHPAADTLREHGFESVEEFNAFRYTDFSFRKFIEAARASAYFENTLFVFVGDHGIGGNAGAMFPPAWTENRLTAFHVPLLFYAPKLVAPRRISSVASMVDILPTVAGLANLAYRNGGLGRDLLKQDARDGGKSNVAFIIDHNDKSVGVVAGQHYSLRRASSGVVQRVWADFSRAPSALEARAADGDASSGDLIDAFFETSRYLLFNNRKARKHE